MTIVRLHNIVMRRAIPYPFSVYVIQTNDGNWYHLNEATGTSPSIKTPSR